MDVFNKNIIDNPLDYELLVFCDNLLAKQSILMLTFFELSENSLAETLAFQTRFQLHYLQHFLLNSNEVLIHTIVFC